MRITTFTRTSAVATILALLVSTGSALAEKDGKGGKGGGGGDGGGSNRSSGGDRSGGSSRSSSGGGDKSSSRSSFKSSDSNKGSSNKSSSGSPSTFRSKGSDDSNKTFQPPKSFQGNPSDSRSKGSRDYQTFRPSDDKGRDVLKQGNDNNNNFKNADRFKDRSPKDRELVDREYSKWRNTWNGDKNDKGDRVGDGKNNHDHRDWSGSWKNSDRFNTADRIRNDWRGRKGNDFAFSDNWWNGKHRGNYWNFWGDYGRRNRNPYYWWSWTNGPRLGSWYAFNWQTPYYWDYGPGEYIYSDNGAIYVNGRWYQPAPVFYNQTVQLIDQAPDLTADTAAKLDWMPLGVFAVTPDGLNEPDVTVQLATTKDGVIGGTAFDSKTGAAYNIEGMVDKKTQRAVWSYTNDRNNRIIMETSVYNLTQPEATGLVHYSPTDMRVVELVRLQQPDAGSTAAPSLPEPPSSP